MFMIEEKILKSLIKLGIVSEGGLGYEIDYHVTKSFIKENLNKEYIISQYEKVRKTLNKDIDGSINIINKIFNSDHNKNEKD